MTGIANMRRASPSRVGMTLIELLVVVAIVIIVFAAIIPNVRPAIEQARLRETARQVNAYFASAQALAIQQQRGVGVVIPRQATNPGGALEIFAVETPPPYAGDSQSSYASVSGATANLSGASYLDSLVGAGDFIRFNYRGPFHQITNVSGASVSFSAVDGYLPPTSGSVPFQIYRKPVRSAVAALQFPRGTCIDVSQSGIGPTGTFNATSTNPITVMFGPSGQVSLYYDGTTPVTPTGSLYLLVGKYDKLGTENLADTENRWISVRMRSGQVVTAENGAGGTIVAARQFALEGKGMGGQ